MHPHAKAQISHIVRLTIGQLCTELVFRMVYQFQTFFLNKLCEIFQASRQSNYKPAVLLCQIPEIVSRIEAPIHNELRLFA